MTQSTPHPDNAGQPAAVPPYRRRSRWRWLLASALLLISAFLLAWLWQMDREVRSSFAALQWALPARIYARPLELYSGARVEQDTLIDTLQRLGYRTVDNVLEAGEFRRAGTRVEVFTRGFEFWDGSEPAQFAEINFNDNRVASLRDQNDRPMPLLRLEPVEITQINPDTGQDRLPLVLDDVPRDLINAVIAVEDARFYEHPGIDIRGILRALVANIRAGGIVQGGSTLTQQLVKNLFLHRDQTLRRKAEEALMALMLDWHFSKDAILEAYLNEVFLAQDGNRAIHGFALGAEFYFGRPLHDLSLDELALLAGLPRGPSLYNPRRNPERALRRRDTVLARMADAGFITAQQQQQASSASLELSARPPSRGSGFPAFMDLVRRDLARDYDADALRTQGLRIFTTLDTALQRRVESTLDTAVTALGVDNNLDGERVEAAVVITDATTGDVRALQGGRRPGYSGFNRALDARRQIGSLVKPAVYLAALESGRFNLGSVLMDERINLTLPNGDIWSPRNVDNNTYGPVYFHEALERSLNLATVDLGLQLGVPETARMIDRLSARRDVPHFPSILLGAVDMTPIEVAQMYQTLAAGGFYSPLRAVEAVTTGTGGRLQRYSLATEQVADPAQVYLLEYALQQTFERGTARGVRGELGGARLPLAGKTGTTNDTRDSWFAGYGDDLVGVVWLGLDNNGSTGLTGSSGALRVWSALARALDIQPRSTLPAADVQWIPVADPAPGPLASKNCSHTRTLPFVSASQPADNVRCDTAPSVFERVIDRVRSFRP